MTKRTTKTSDQPAPQTAPAPTVLGVITVVEGGNVAHSGIHKGNALHLARIMQECVSQLMDIASRPDPPAETPGEGADSEDA